MEAYKDNCSLLVNSCDKYETTWYPYFELIKKYWPNHPENIFLNTETKEYSHLGVNINCINHIDGKMWGERLYDTLEKIPTKYIIFSLEDFFLRDYVKDEVIQRYYEIMENDPRVAVCRLDPSNLNTLTKSEEFYPLYIAEKETPFRLDTQAALWNRETLMEFIDKSEDPWEFEGNGTERVKKSKKIFLWSYQENIFDIKKSVFPYMVYQPLGYGVAWGRWLWNNKQWFEHNDIFNVKYYKLGVINEKNAKNRMNILYKKNIKGFNKILKVPYKILDLIEKSIHLILIFGLKKGIKLICKYAKHNK